MSTHTPTTPDQLEEKMFTLINRFRATKSLPPYTWNATVANVSRAHSVLMGTGCGLSHQCPGEPDPFQRLTNAGISWQAAAENVGWAEGYPDNIQTIMQGFIDEGPGGGHYDNLVSTVYTDVGVGVYIDTNGGVWATQDFVQPQSSTSS